MCRPQPCARSIICWRFGSARACGRKQSRRLIGSECGANFRDKDKIHTRYETTATGVVVEQTSDDAQTVAALQTHAAEVTDLVKGGMAALQTAMMKNHGGTMGGGMMHGPMMMRGGMMHRGAI